MLFRVCEKFNVDNDINLENAIELKKQIKLMKLEGEDGNNDQACVFDTSEDEAARAEAATTALPEPNQSRGFQMHRDDCGTRTVGTDGCTETLDRESSCRHGRADIPGWWNG